MAYSVLWVRLICCLVRQESPRHSELVCAMKITPVDPLSDADQTVRRVGGTEGGQSSDQVRIGNTQFQIQAFGSLLAKALKPPLPLSGVGRGTALNFPVDALSVVSGAASESRLQGDSAVLPLAPVVVPTEVAARLGMVPVDDPGAGRGRNSRLPFRQNSGQDGDEEEIGGELVPEAGAVVGIGRAATSGWLTADGASQTANFTGPEQVEEFTPEGGSNTLSVVRTGVYARAQAALGVDERARSSDDTEILAAAAITGDTTNSAVVNFADGIKGDQLRVVRRGEDLVISLAGFGDVLMVRGATRRGAPALLFGDGTRISGLALLDAAERVGDIARPVDKKALADGDLLA